jgi:hypothetical protein
MIRGFCCQRLLPAEGKGDSLGSTASGLWHEWSHGYSLVSLSNHGALPSGSTQAPSLAASRSSVTIMREKLVCRFPSRDGMPLLLILDEVLALARSYARAEVDGTAFIVCSRRCTTAGNIASFKGGKKMFLEKTPARPSASLCLPGPLWPSGKPFARASRESEAAPLCLSVLRAVSDARRSCRRILLLRRLSCRAACSERRITAKVRAALTFSFACCLLALE